MEDPPSKQKHQGPAGSPGQCPHPRWPRKPREPAVCVCQGPRSRWKDGSARFREHVELSAQLISPSTATPPPPDIQPTVRPHFFRPSCARPCVRCGRHQGWSTSLRGEPLCAELLCSPRAAPAADKPSRRLCARAERAAFTLFPNNTPFGASAAASAVCLPLAASALC